MSAPAAEQLVRQIVRGEKPIELLETVGLRVTDHEGSFRVDGAGTAVVRPTLEDVAVGISNCAGRDEYKCRKWAAVLLAASAVIDLKCLEDRPEGSVLLEAMWDAAKGGSIRDEDAAVARRLVSASGAQT